MFKLNIHRKKKFAGALMPYWVITDISKEEFMQKYSLDGDLCDLASGGQVIARLDVRVLEECGGIQIRNGESVCIEKDQLKSVFAVTIDGCLSNEVTIQNKNIDEINLILTTKGGFVRVSYPYFE